MERIYKPLFDKHLLCFVYIIQPKQTNKTLKFAEYVATLSSSTVLLLAE